jgi:TIR domain
MPGGFISYRRDDSGGYAGRLFDILSAQFGKENTYMDLDTIEGGDDFIAVIEAKINLSDVLLAVIGTRWLTVTEQNGARRLDNPGDFVRNEIGKALERGIRVIPVLVGGAIMPRADELPDDLRALSERQAVDIRDSHFHADANSWPMYCTETCTASA